MIQQISSQSFGSPSTPTSFGGGVPTVNTSNGAQGGGGGGTNVTIDIVGSEGATFSRSQVESLANGLNDYVGDGGTVFSTNIIGG